MHFTVKALTPALATVFVEYLGNLSFAHAPHWATCFCRYYHTDCSPEQWQSRTGAENRAEAIEQIRAGNMRGYLAFVGDRCIGWCNANDARQFIRLTGEVQAVIAGKKVGCVICFVIDPDYRNQGVARLLLKQAVADFAAQGYEAVLALPVEGADAPEKRYRGTLHMYRELGFRELERHGNLRVMWLACDR